MMRDYFKTGTFGGSDYGDLTEGQAVEMISEKLPYSMQLLVYNRFAKSFKVNKNSGLTVMWMRLEKLNAATTPLQEWKIPNYDKPQETVIQGDVYYYGSWIPFSHLTENHYNSDWVKDKVKLQSDQYMLTVDTILGAKTKGGTQVGFARSTGTAAEGSINATITGALGLTSTTPGGDNRFLNMAISVLEGNDAPKLTSLIAPHINQTTQGIRESYFAVAHTNLRQDIEALDGFLPVEQYAKPGEAVKGEVGAAGGVRFICSTNAVVTQNVGATTTNFLRGTGKNDVYDVTIFAEDAFGALQVSGLGGFKPIIVLPKAGPGQPLGQQGSVGWKAPYGCALLDDERMYRVRCAASSHAI